MVRRPPVVENGSGTRYSDGACELCPCRVLGAAVVRQSILPPSKGTAGGSNMPLLVGCAQLFAGA